MEVLSAFAYLDPTHRHFFTENQLHQLLRQAGLKIIKESIPFYQFPLAPSTLGFKRGIFWGLVRILFLLPLKLLAFAGLNKEIVRLYLSPQKNS